jgi:5-(carboxyamino)imidazole ribonucleotide mutase
MKKPLVGIIMGSRSDLAVMAPAAEVLETLGVPCEVTIISAHRTPERAFEYASQASERGLQVIIAGAGGAAHLAGVVAALTTLPVIGVPVKSTLSLDGWDSILSMLQMPPGVPVATVALDGAQNAGILAAQILALSDKHIARNLASYRDALKKKVQESAEDLSLRGYKKLLGKEKPASSS